MGTRGILRSVAGRWFFGEPDRVMKEGDRDSPLPAAGPLENLARGGGRMPGGSRPSGQRLVPGRARPQRERRAPMSHGTGDGPGRPKRNCSTARIRFHFPIRPAIVRRTHRATEPPWGRAHRRRARSAIHWGRLPAPRLDVRDRSGPKFVVGGFCRKGISLSQHERLGREGP